MHTPCVQYIEYNAPKPSAVHTPTSRGVLYVCIADHLLNFFTNVIFFLIVCMYWLAVCMYALHTYISECVFQVCLADRYICIFCMYVLRVIHLSCLHVLPTSILYILYVRFAGMSCEPKIDCLVCCM